MTAPVTVELPAANGHHRITVERHQLVGQVMDWQALAQEALYANGAALQILMRLEKDAVVYEAIRAAHDTHNHLAQLLAHLRGVAGLLDRTSD